MIDYDKQYGKVIASFPDSFVARFLYNQVRKVHSAVLVYSDEYEAVFEYDTCRWVFYSSPSELGTHLVQCDVRRFDE